MVPDRAGGQLEPVTNAVILECVNIQRVFAFQIIHTALGHRERVMREIDLLRLLIKLVHREINDPAEFVDTAFTCCLVPFRQSITDGVTGKASEFRGGRFLVTHEENCVAFFKASNFTKLGLRGFGDKLRNRACALTVFKQHIAKTGSTLLLRPAIELVKEAAWLISHGRRADRTHNTAIGNDAFERFKFHVIAGENFRYINNFQRVSQIRLVGTVFQHRFLVRNIG